MQKSRIIEMLIETIRSTGLSNFERVSAESSLFGDNSLFDSMGLVNFVVDVETRFQAEGIKLSLMSEDAMSKRRSPFRSIASLADFIQEQISSEDNHA